MSMKRIRTLLMTGLAAFALAMAPTVFITAGQASAVSFVEEEEATELIRGVVKEKTENELTVKDQVDEAKETKIRLTEDTSYVKDGQPAKAEDVTEGDRVRVKATKSFLGRYEAVEVTILPRSEDPPPAF
jgi:hypothetical protein